MSLEQGMKDTAPKKFPIYDKAAQRKEQTELTTKNHQIHDNDTGSSEVQIALLSHRIAEIAVHSKANRQDAHCQHALIKLVNQRRRLLKYLARTNTTSYKQLIEKLGLRK